MTKAELLKALEGIADDTPILVYDHWDELQNIQVEVRNHTKHGPFVVLDCLTDEDAPCLF